MDRAIPTRWPSGLWSATWRRGSQGRVRRGNHPAGQCLRPVLGDVDRRNRRAHSRGGRGAAKRHSMASTTASMWTIWSMPSSPPVKCRTAEGDGSSSPDRRQFPGPRCSPLMRKAAAGRSSKRNGTRPRCAGAISEHCPVKRQLNGLVMRASSHLASRIGTSRVKALRARLSALRRKAGGALPAGAG